MGNVECLADRKETQKYDNELQEIRDDFVLRLSRLSSAEPEPQELKEHVSNANSINMQSDIATDLGSTEQQVEERRSTIQAAMSAANKTKCHRVGEPSIPSLSNDLNYYPITITRNPREHSLHHIIIERKNVDGTSIVSARRIKQLSAENIFGEIVQFFPHHHQQSTESLTFTIASPRK